MPFSQVQMEALEKFIINNKDLAVLEAKISRFNIFEAIGMVRREIKHSNFIAFLLDPSQKHLLGDIFLKRVLTHISLNAENLPLSSIEIAIANFNDAEVKREWKHIDLLIYSQINQCVCVFENKVDSSERPNQLENYENTVDREFPDYKKIFIYLTKEGDSASRDTWVVLSYKDLVDIFDAICNERKSMISEDIYLSIRHYIDLVRKHLLGESGIADLCRNIYRQHRMAIEIIYESKDIEESGNTEICQKIYKQHRPAIEMIYEHRSDLRAYIKEFLEQIIAESDNLAQEENTLLWIRFAPREWDELSFQTSCSRWTPSSRLLLFEFWNREQSLELRLVIGPGELEIKNIIYNTLRRLNLSGVKRCQIRDSKWTQSYIISVLDPSDYKNTNLRDLEEKIKEFWLNYINGDMKVIRQAIRNLNV